MEEKLTRRVTIRLTPYQAKLLWRLRTEGIPEGGTPRTVTEVLIRPLREAERKELQAVPVEERMKVVGDKE